MTAWQKFEHLVARIHHVLGGDQHTVEQDVTVTEPMGAAHQVDVLITPKSPFLGRVLVSCKSSGEPVGMDHVREWSDIVQQTGSASGVIVSPTGFTAGAIDLARNPARRVTLWIARALSDADFAPDEGAPSGYLRKIHTVMKAKVPYPRTDTFKIDCEPADGKREGLEVVMTFSAATRDRYYLRDESDNVVGNLWDDYIAAASVIHATGLVRVTPPEPRFLIVEGRRIRLISLSVEIEVQVFELETEIDFAQTSYGYENAVTQEVKFVPLAQMRR